MTRFERSNVALDHTAEPHDFDRVFSQCPLMVIPQSHEKEKSRQEDNDDDANRGPRQEFERKVLWAKKPRDASSENPATSILG